jgi:hypothetical protein
VTLTNRNSSLLTSDYRNRAIFRNVAFEDAKMVDDVVNDSRVCRYISKNI